MPRSIRVELCPHLMAPSYCPACLAAAHDEYTADRLAASDPERETCRRDFLEWAAGLTTADETAAAFRAAVDAFTLPDEGTAYYVVPDESEVA